MKRQPRILAGTAIGLLMASAPLGAFPLSGKSLDSFPGKAPLILAQEECQGENCPPKQEQQQKQQAPAEEQAPAQQPAPEPQPEAAPSQPRGRARASATTGGCTCRTGSGRAGSGCRGT